VALLTAGSAVYAAGTPTGGILIDPGHSPKSPGTTSCSAKPEYFYNNALAKTVAAFLASKQVAVTLTHAENEEVTLLQRTQRSSGGALLLSLHHDSVQPQFLSRQSRTRGYCSKKAKGFSIFVSRKNPYFKTSLRYATALGTALLKKGFTPTLHHAEPIAGENRELLIPDKGIYVFDELIVLKIATSPAVLLEAAVIVNPDDDALAGSEKFRLAVAESVYEMLDVLR
jgi:N-acetylmuramoyl-L-alanine amidase